MIYSLILSDLFVLIILTYFANHFLEFRFVNRYLRLFIFIISFIIMLSININGMSNSKAKLILLLFIIYIFFQFNGKPFNKILVVIHSFIVFAISEVCISLIFSALGLLNNNSLTNEFQFSFILFLSGVLVFILVKIHLYCIRFFQTNSLPKYSWVIFILPLSTIILVLNIPNYYNLIESNASLAITLIGLFLSNTIFVLVFINSIKKMNLENELEMEKYKQKHSQTKYDLLDQQHRSNFKLIHDIMHKCNSLNDSIESKNLESIKKELDEITTLAFSEFNAVYSNSVIINTLISNRLDTLHKNNITIKSTIEYNNFEFIDFCDQIDLFSNLIDYAIDNTIKSNEYKTILIKSNIISKQLLISFQFPVTELKDINQEIGDIIQIILDKYNGKFSISKHIDNLISIVIVFDSVTLEKNIIK